MSDETNGIPADLFPFAPGWVMTRQRRIRGGVALVAFLTCCISSGCSASYTTRPVEITVTNRETRKPENHLRVTVNYRYMLVLNAPNDAEGITDKVGKVILPIADFDKGAIDLKVGPSVFSLDVQMIREGGKPTWFAGYNDEEKQSYVVLLTPKKGFDRPNLFSFLLGIMAIVVIAIFIILIWRKKAQFWSEQQRENYGNGTHFEGL